MAYFFAGSIKMAIMTTQVLKDGIRFYPSLSLGRVVPLPSTRTKAFRVNVQTKTLDRV